MSSSTMRKTIHTRTLIAIVMLLGTSRCGGRVVEGGLCDPPYACPVLPPNVIEDTLVCQGPEEPCPCQPGPSHDWVAENCPSVKFLY